MTHVRAVWHRLVRCDSMLANIIETCERQHYIERALHNLGEMMIGHCRCAY